MAVLPQVTRWLWCAESAVLSYRSLTEAQVLAQIHVESAGDPRAVSPVGAQGLMQLMPGTASALGVRDPFDPLENVRGGVHYMAELLREFGSYDLALAAYNAGPGAVQQAGNQVPDIPQTQEYVRLVREAEQDYSRYLATTRPLPALAPGNEGDAVRLLQSLLGVQADGIYGPKTLEAVVAHKRRSGLPENGIVGAGLWSYLLYLHEGGGQ